VNSNSNHLIGRLLEGAASPEVADVDAAYFEAVRDHVRGRDA
jgi:hypothetical protein